MPYNFRKSLKAGTAGEERIMRWMKSTSAISHVDDFRHDKTHQKEDVDFCVTFNDGTKKTVELKTDGTNYPNLYYEEMSAVETGSVGCMVKTTADCILYYYSVTGLIYRFTTSKFRAWVARRRDEIVAKNGLKQVKNWRYNGTTYTSTGIAIPRAMIDADLKEFGKKGYLKN